MSRLSEIHELIHKLSKSEKKTFRMYSSQTPSGRAGQLNQLYTLLLEQVEFDSVEIDKQLTQRGLKRNLNTLTPRLRQQIFLSQRTLYADRSIESRIYNALEEISFLFAKQMLPLAQRTLTKTRKLAARFSRTHLDLILLNWQRKILRQQQPADVKAQYLALDKEEMRSIELLSLQTQLTGLTGHLRLLGGKWGQAKSDLEKKGFQELAQPDLLARGLAESDFLCRAYALHSQGIFHLVEGEYSAAFKIYLTLMEQWESDPEWPAMDSDFFLSTWNNYQLSVMYGTETLDHVKRFLSFIRDIPIQEAQQKLKLARISYQTELVVFLNQAEFEEAGPFLAELTLWLKKQESQLSTSSLLTFYFNICMFNFLKEDFSAANKQVMHILNLQGTRERADIRNMARLLQVIFHCELGNLDLAENFHRSAKRYFTHADPDGLESKILAILKPLVFDTPDAQKMFKNIHTHLSATDQPDSSSENRLGKTELILWAESRSTHQSLRTLFTTRTRER